jgi:hypothetical protein
LFDEYEKTDGAMNRKGWKNLMKDHGLDVDWLKLNLIWQNKIKDEDNFIDFD